MELLIELKKELEKTNLSIDELSKKIDINLKNILDGKQKIEMSELLKIIDFINPSIERATELVGLFKKSNDLDK